MKILVVDDTYFMRELICESLQEQGFKELTQASNGEEALNALSNKHYDLIVTDWNMPKINGVELIKKMKLNPALRHTKIIMLTGDTTPEKILEMKELGVNGYISKPFTPELLTELVIKLS
ncbi:response regulator [Pseudoalteromonas luteoviolacea]|uniref:response regulator n=1 Tax=Pseudoalteromonas luteoviolacea TaxID=43657 RepID=UPI001B37CC2F|nr:response regulator [Pseudoalteromonas luteoviolacea]MBQ4835840.1 response regulator [Pseudoalteromonas luteoviolacea]